VIWLFAWDGDLGFRLVSRDGEAGPGRFRSSSRVPLSILDQTSVGLRCVEGLDGRRSERVVNGGLRCSGAMDWLSGPGSLDALADNVSGR
jgi:hypothetical protein